jgi:hypothetical protein
VIKSRKWLRNYSLPGEDGRRLVDRASSSGRSLLVLRRLLLDGAGFLVDPSSNGAGIIGVARSLEEEVRLLRSGGLETFDREGSEGNEEDPEGDDDSNAEETKHKAVSKGKRESKEKGGVTVLLSPEVRVAVVAELDTKVVVSGNERLTSDGSSNGAGEVSAGGVVSSDSSGDERLSDTVKAEQKREMSWSWLEELKWMKSSLGVVELVKHGRLETVVERVKPSSPAEPRLHAALRDLVTVQRKVENERSQLKRDFRKAVWRSTRERRRTRCRE